MKVVLLELKNNLTYLIWWITVQKIKLKVNLKLKKK